MSPEIILFIDGDHFGSRNFTVIPRVGDAITFEKMDRDVLVCEVSFQWDDPEAIQLNTSTINLEEDGPNDDP